MQARSSNNVKIIDVSHHQGKINWPKVKAAGIAGVYIKATEGKTYVDLKFAANAAGASAAGIPIGYYHYARPELNSPEDEAANFYRNVKGQPVDFPYVLDVEGEAADLGPVKLTAWCVKWLQEVERLSGRTGMLYTGASFARSNLGPELRPWPLWVANYGVETPMSNSTWSCWSVFQYTSDGVIDGIVGRVDLNAMEQSFFEQYCGGGNVSSPAPLVPKVVVDGQLAATGEIRDGKLWAPVADVLSACGIEGTWNGDQKKLYIYLKGDGAE